MEFSGGDYINAAMQRIHSARILFDHRLNVDAVYLAGTAVECTLRAFASQTGKPFDGRHDLRELLRMASFTPLARGDRGALAAALGTVWARWKNNYRYAPEDKIRKEYKDLGLDRGIKGDFLRQNAREALESAFDIVNKGAARWKKQLSASS